MKRVTSAAVAVPGSRAGAGGEGRDCQPRRTATASTATTTASAMATGHTTHGPGTSEPAGYAAAGRPGWASTRRAPASAVPRGG